jgi:hypothetical protein
MTKYQKGVFLCVLFLMDYVVFASHLANKSCPTLNSPLIANSLR